MGFRFYRRAKLFGGFGLNFSGSGVGWSLRTPFGSIGNKGGSIRTGITGLYYRFGFGSKTKAAKAEAELRRAQKNMAKVETAQAVLNEVSTFDFSLDENHVPKVWVSITKDFKHIKIVHKENDTYSISASGMDTEDGTAQTALVELTKLKSEMTRLKKALQELEKFNSEMALSANKMISEIEPLFMAIKTIEAHIKKALKDA